MWLGQIKKNHGAKKKKKKMKLLYKKGKKASMGYKPKDTIPYEEKKNART